MPLCMKTKISITLEEALLRQVERKLEEGLFRNKSHVIEYSIKKFLEGEDGK